MIKAGKGWRWAPRIPTWGMFSTSVFFASPPRLRNPGNVEHFCIETLMTLKVNPPPCSRNPDNEKHFRCHFQKKAHQYLENAKHVKHVKRFLEIWSLTFPGFPGGTLKVTFLNTHKTWEMWNLLSKRLKLGKCWRWAPLMFRKPGHA